MAIPSRDENDNPSDSSDNSNNPCTMNEQNVLNSSGEVQLYDRQMRKDLTEFEALLADANAIGAPSIGDVLWNIGKFVIDEASPFVLIMILLNFREISSLLYFLVNIILSSLVATYLCREKRKGTTTPTTTLNVLKSICLKALSLLCFWISEYSRETKRKGKLQNIQMNIFRTRSIDDTNRWIEVTKDTLNELTNLYSSNYRYKREDLILTTIRSFCCAMLSIYNIVDPVNMSLHICKPMDALRFIYFVYAIVKTSLVIGEFQKAERQFIAALRLRDLVIRETETVGLKLCQYHMLQKLDIYSYCIKEGLDFGINFSVIGSRYLVYVISMISGFAYFCSTYGVLMVADIFLLDPFKFNSSNAPAYSFNTWFDRTMGIIFYSYGYSIGKLKGRFGWKVLFTVPTVVGIIVIMLLFQHPVAVPSQYQRNVSSSLFSHLARSESIDNTSDRFSTKISTFCSSVGLVSFTQYTNESFSIMNCIQYGMLNNPINVFDYVGGVNNSIWIVIVVSIACLLFECSLKYLLKYKRIDLEAF